MNLSWFLYTFEPGKLRIMTENMALRGSRRGQHTGTSTTSTEHTKQQQNNRNRASLAVQTDTATESEFETFVRNTLSSILEGQSSLRASIENLQAQHNDLEKTVERNAQELGDSLNFQSSRTDEAEKNITKMTAVNSKLQAQHKHQQSEIKQLKESRDNLERHSRRNNLLLCNYPETKKEKPEHCEKIVNNIIKEKLGLEKVCVEVAHRLGRRPEDKKRHRPIIFKLLSLRDKDSILKGKENIKDESYYIKTDDIESDRKEKQRLKSVADQAFKEGKKPKFRRGKLYIDNQLYREESSATSDADSDATESST